MMRAYIGLGSNLDNPLQQLKQAIDAIALLPAVEMIAVSPWYKTAPVGYQDQPDFINGVVAIDTMLDPQALLLALQAIENAQGRVRDKNNRNGPRTIDLDILLYGDQRVNMPGLTIPHPRMYERDFVMRPLSDLCPELCSEH